MTKLKRFLEDPLIVLPRDKLSPLPAILLLAFGQCSTGCQISYTDPVASGPYGTYVSPTKQIRLEGDRTYPVYRVKYWTFTNGDPPALQLEFEAPFSVMDLDATRRLSAELWTVFGRYVAAMELSAAIITGTNLMISQDGTVSTRHTGFVVRRDSAGRWLLEGDTLPLPPIAESSVAGIFEHDGKVFEEFTRFR